MRKENSSNYINESRLKEACGTIYALSVIGSRWKPIIIWRLLKGKSRFSELRKSIPGISERILALSLKELEKDGLIQKEIYPEVPPRVEYELTHLGLTMRPMMESIASWGESYQTNRNSITTGQ